MFIYSTTDSDGSLFYNQEALVSAISLRRHTDQPIRLFTNSEVANDLLKKLPYSPFDDVFLFKEKMHPKIQKVKSILHSTDDQSVFVDADTVILDDISKVFSIGEFDFAGNPAVWREDIPDINHAVVMEPQRWWRVRSGVLFMRRAKIENILQDWYTDLCEQVETKKENPKAVRDQRSLDKVLFKTKPNLLHLPTNYNFQSMQGGTISGAVFVVHGHLFKNRLRPYNFFPEKGVIDLWIDLVNEINSSMKTANIPATDKLEPGVFERN